MLHLDDPRWEHLTSGYKLPFDARPLLRRIAAAPSAPESWEPVWDELHHQGDLGTASYAVVPHLVAIFAGIPRHWELYAYLALVDLERRRKTNPPIPDWLDSTYHAARLVSKGLALKDLADSTDPLLRRTALSVVAFTTSQTALGALLTHLDESEVEEFLEDRMDWSTTYRHVAG